jgi:hypothetical protein
VANNSQKTSFARSLERFAHQRAQDAYNLTGKGLPCSVVKVEGSIVTVKFEVESVPFTIPNMRVPMFGLEYIRYPVQEKDKGVVVPFDVLLGAISALGGNVAQLGLPPSNLGALVFAGISSVNWTAVDDPNKLVMYGPNGFETRDTGNNCSVVGDKENLTLTAKTTLTLQVGGKKIVINGSGITIDGILWETHEHTGVTGGTAKTGGPVAP